MALSRRVNRLVSPSDFSLELQTIDADQYHAESNIRERFGRDEKATHDVIGSGLLLAPQHGLRDGQGDRRSLQEHQFQARSSCARKVR
jgi:hypothetical protein